MASVALGAGGTIVSVLQTQGPKLILAGIIVTPAATSKSPTCGRVKIPQARRQEWVDC